MEENIFLQYLREAEGEDSRPEEAAPTDDITDAPPDIPDDTDNPGDAPDIPDDTDAPPDMPDDTGGDISSDDSGFGDFSTDSEENPVEGLDEKISAIMNMNLYQQYISLLNTIQKEIGMLKNNSDILNSISLDVNSIIEGMKKLEENIRLYIKNNYVNENYSKNLLFFNKCLNLLKLINDSFDKKINIELKDS